MAGVRVTWARGTHEQVVVDAEKLKDSEVGGGAWNVKKGLEVAVEEEASAREEDVVLAVGDAVAVAASPGQLGAGRHRPRADLGVHGAKVRVAVEDRPRPVRRLDIDAVHLAVHAQDTRP